MSETTTQATSRDTVFDVDLEQLGRVYAQAVLDAAGDQQDSVMEELKALVAEVLDKFPEFEQVLASALVSQEEKLDLLDRVFGRQLSATSLSFLKVLASHDRLGLLRQVVRSAAALWEERIGRLPCELQLAYETDASLMDEIVTALKRQFKADPVVKTVINPDLIAGFVVRVGDQVYDASVRTSLEHARTGMIARAVEAIQSRPEQFMEGLGAES